jgi:hypothetical protein
MFLDTTHLYQDTRAELLAWIPKLRRDAVLCGHDYLLHLHPRWSDRGVRRAVDEIVAESTRWELVVHQRDHGLFILLPKDPS